MRNLIFISKGELYKCSEGKPLRMSCEIIDRYKRNVQEINRRKEWKTTGTGAVFMFGKSVNSKQAAVSNVTGAALHENGIVYSAVMDDNMAIYEKSLDINETSEEMILRKNDMAVYDISINREHDKITASCGTGGFDRHIAIINKKIPDTGFVTEGDSIDCNPIFDPCDSNIIYYDSCGIASQENGYVSEIGPKSVMKLNLGNGETEDILSHASHDYFKPKIYGGRLYYIKKPYKSMKRGGVTLKDIIFAPFKIIKAILGWLDHFTRSYAGESLKTSGTNPSKNKQLSEKEVFIEGNLINAESTLRQNSRAGGKYPGIAPGNWELTVKNADGSKTLIKKGVMDYDIAKDGAIIYSNGKYIIEIIDEPQNDGQRNATQSEKVICAAELAVKLNVE